MTTLRGTYEKHGEFENDLEFFLILDSAKEIAMFTGKNSHASEELN